MNYRIRVAGLTALAVLWCAPSAGQEDPPVAIVNGEPLPQSLLDAYVQTRSRNATGSPIDELILQDLLRREALTNDLEKRPEVIALLEVAQRNVLANMAVKEFLEASVPDEAALRKAYDEQYGGDQVDGQEYKARHILVASEEDAGTVIEALNGGADFAELAKERSTGPSGPNGGDLGWFSADSMVPSFADAVRSMEPDNYSETPVQTQFGWHVILLENTRALEPPSFESVTTQLTQQAQRDALTEYMRTLREAAEVEIK